jgi:mannose-6-phosphate isomerase class I
LEYNQPDIKEFKVLSLKVCAGQQEKLLLKGPSIVCVVEGSAKIGQVGFTSLLAHKGQVLFVAAEQAELTIQCTFGKFAAYIATTSFQ